MARPLYTNESVHLRYNFHWTCSSLAMSWFQFLLISLTVFTHCTREAPCNINMPYRNATYFPTSMWLNQWWGICSPRATCSPPDQHVGLRISSTQIRMQHRDRNSKISSV